MNWQCKECDSDEARFMTTIIVSAPFSRWKNLPKKALSGKGTKLHGVDWGNSTILCCGCGAATELAYPTEYAVLQQRVKELEDTIRVCYSHAVRRDPGGVESVILDMVDGVDHDSTYK